MITQFLVNMLMAQSMAHFWSAINSLQLISFMSLFNGLFPQNFITFGDSVLELVNFDILPADTIY